MDGALRNGLAFAPIVNCHGLWANQPSGPNGIFGDHPAAPKTTRSAMWLAAVTTDMISELVFILQGSSDKWANELTPGGETTAVLSLTVLTFVPSLSWQSIGFYGFHGFRGKTLRQLRVSSHYHAGGWVQTVQVPLWAAEMRAMLPSFLRPFEAVRKCETLSKRFFGRCRCLTKTDHLPR